MHEEFGLYDLPIDNYYRLSAGEARILPWVAARGDQTHRLEFNLNESSIVYDVGGYKGEWAADIYRLYQCNIEIFEPVDSFVKLLKKKFDNKPKITIYPVGLAGKKQKLKINLDLEASSIFKTDKNAEIIQLERASSYTSKHPHIDLMKINIEGGEYELLEHLISVGEITKIHDIHVQFHDFVPNARQRRHDIQKKLSRTHELTYNYPFIWENWRRKND